MFCIKVGCGVVPGAVTPDCFYCLEVFPPNEIEGWTDDGDTALCPKCGIDSVIGSVSGYPIQREFLSKMHDHWF